MAHLGMMTFLEEQGIAFDFIAGASGGSLVGALYCQGYSTSEILEITKKTSLLRMVKPALNLTSLLSLESSAKILEEFFPEDRFDALKKPLVISATNLVKGKVKYFKKGQLIRPIIASCSIPVIFDPVRINGTAYIDGGIVENQPFKPLKKKCDYLIGMHCNPIGKKSRVGNWKDLMERSLQLAITTSTYRVKNQFDLFLEPYELTNYGVFDLKKMDEIYKVGYDYAAAYFENNPVSVPTVA